LYSGEYDITRADLHLRDIKENSPVVEKNPKFNRIYDLISVKELLGIPTSILHG
jgi:hypothetical protein